MFSVVSEVLSRVNELSVQMSNGTFNAADRSGAGKDVDGLLKEMINALNTQVGGRFLFGGRVDDAPPFAQDGTYSGDDGQTQVEIAPGVQQAATVRADVAITGVNGGVNIPKTIIALRDALNANDVNGVLATFGDLQTSITQVASARSEGGAAYAVLTSSTSISRLLRDASATTASSFTEVDQVEAATNLAFAEVGLNAAISASAKSFQLSMLDKL